MQTEKKGGKLIRQEVISILIIVRESRADCFFYERKENNWKVKTKK